MPRTKQATSRKKDSAENGSRAQSSVPSFAPSSAAGREEEIRRRAYELYEQRGRQDGGAEQDWFRAEAEVTTGNSQRTA